MIDGFNPAKAVTPPNTQPKAKTGHLPEAELAKAEQQAQPQRADNQLRLGVNQQPGRSAPTGQLPASQLAGIQLPPDAILPPPSARGPIKSGIPGMLYPGAMTPDGKAPGRRGQRGTGMLGDVPMPGQQEEEAQIPVHDQHGHHAPGVFGKPPRKRIFSKKGRELNQSGSFAEVDCSDPIDTAAALGELGVVGVLAEVALAYTRAKFDPGEIGASLGRFMETMGQVHEQVSNLPGVGELLLGLGGLGAIVSGVKNLRDGIATAKSAEDLPDKVKASMGAAAGAAKIVGGLATALTPVCVPLGAVGAAIVGAGVALDAGRLALENRAPLKSAMGIFQNKLAALVPAKVRQAVQDTAEIVSNNTSKIVAQNTARIVANNSSA